MKTNLRDTTFILPIRIDSIIRLENLLLTLDNIESNFDTTIILIEASYYKNQIVESLIGKNVDYIFIEDKDPIFHRTKHINSVCSQIETPIIGIWDADVIIRPMQVIEAIEQLRMQACDVAYPYDGNFFDTSYILRRRFFQNRDITFLDKNISKMQSLYSSEDNADAVGGAFLVASDKYKYAGGENEFFYGWGPEDGERYCRWTTLEFKIYRSKGCLFHLSHPRDINGGKGIPDITKEQNYKLLKYVSDLSKRELERFIEKNHWVNTKLKK